MQALFLLLQNLETTIPSFDSINKQVSQSSVGWHIEHSCKVISSIINALQVSNPQTYRWRFNSTRSFVYIIGFIPRGRGKAPKVVVPEGPISEKSLRDSILLVREKLAAWDSLQINSYFEHPYFGMLNKKQTERFLVIHTRHHMKIIADICNKA